MSNITLSPLTSIYHNQALKGQVTASPDKSISHRSLIFASLATGVSTITNLLEGEDVLKTAQALRKMGVEIKRIAPAAWQVNGVTTCGLIEPNDILDMGNSGTSCRLLMGLTSTCDFTTFFTGDESLRKRPMKRVFDPLKEMGANIISRSNNLLPCAIIGAKEPLAINYKLDVPSAQIKSAIILAALNTLGTTTIIETEKSRDHTEIMLGYLGAEIKNQETEYNGQIVNQISIQGGQEFGGRNFTIPGDISSAAFIIVAALLIPGSKVEISNIGINPLRTGILTTLKEMEANIEIKNQRRIGGEEVADIVVEYSELKAVNIPANRAPSMIDEYPILSIAAASAKGTTKMHGLAELKVKESNRLNAIVEGLIACGVEVTSKDDYIEIEGGIHQSLKPIEIKTNLDHRIAMSFLIMGLKLKSGLTIDDSSIINTSFPNFIKTFEQLGVKFY